MEKLFFLFAVAALVFAGCKRAPEQVKVTGVEVEPATLTLEIGDRQTLEATVSPANADTGTVSWSSSAPDIVAVDAATGEVTAIAEGGVQITATTTEGGFTDICDVTVNPEPDEPGNVMHPVSANDEVISFFEMYLPSISVIPSSQCFFIGDEEDRCLRINSADEFRAAASSSVSELPEIDFNNHTLVIGQIYVPGTDFRITDQNIEVEADSEQMTFNVTIYEPVETFTIMCMVYYWGIYNKLPERAIEVKMNFEQ